MKLWRTAAAPGIALTIALGAGCGQKPPATPAAGKTAASPAPKQQETATQVQLVLNWFPEAEHGGYYAAEAHGFYRKAGLKVKILPGGPESPVIARVARGDIPFGVSSATHLLFGLAQEAPVVAVMAPLQTSPRCIMVHEKSGIQSFNELKNMTLAMSPRAAFAHYLKKKYPLENVKIVPYPGNVTQFLMNLNFAQQGYNISEPFVARKKGGDPRVLMVADIGFNPYTSILVTNRKMVREQPEVVRKMVRAAVQGWSKYLEDPVPTNQLIHRLNPEMDMDILAFGARELKSLVLTDAAFANGIGTMSRERWRKLFEQMVEAEQLKPGSLNIDDAYDTTFLPKGK